MIFNILEPQYQVGDINKGISRYWHRYLAIPRDLSPGSYSFTLLTEEDKAIGMWGELTIGPAMILH